MLKIAIDRGEGAWASTIFATAVEGFEELLKKKLRSGGRSNNTNYVYSYNLFPDCGAWVKREATPSRSLLQGDFISLKYSLSFYLKL